MPLLAALLTGGASADGGVRQGPPPSPRAQVEAALVKSAGASDLQRLARTSETELIAVAGDRAAAATLRGRALAALAYATDARGHTFLENFIIRTTPSRDPVDHALLGEAAMALGWQGGPRLVELVSPLLDDTDREVRLNAAVALGLSRSRDAEKPLRARQATETDAGVRRQIDIALHAVTSPR